MAYLEGKKPIIIGGAGFVGSNLVKAALAQGAREVHVVDNLLSAERENLPEDDRLTFVLGSITDDAVLAELPEDAEVVFHLATFHGNQNSIADPLADHENNTLTTLKLCDRAKDLPALECLVYASAGCTVAEKTFDDAGATSEDAPVSLWHDSPYQMSKIFGELYLNYYLLRHDLPGVKARFQNVYGPGEVLGAGEWRGTVSTVWRNVVPTFVWKALHAEALPLDNGGAATRDFIYVDDIVRGLIACAERGEPGGVYNLASGEETSILALAELINELTANPTPREIAPARDWDRSGRRHGDPAKAAADLGFRADVPLREGLVRTIEWTRASESLIERCIRRHAERVQAVAA